MRERVCGDGGKIGGEKEMYLERSVYIWRLSQALTNYISNKVEFKLQIMEKEWAKWHGREEGVELARRREE